VATVVPSTTNTDVNGFATIAVIYPKDHATWVEVTLSALTSVSGTEFSRSVDFVLPGLASDYTNKNVSPPGAISPYGMDSTCSDAL
jgi:hypothetical protein